MRFRSWPLGSQGGDHPADPPKKSSDEERHVPDAEHEQCASDADDYCSSFSWMTKRARHLAFSIHEAYLSQASPTPDVDAMWAELIELLGKLRAAALLNPQ